MKKRIACLVLALVMLVGMFPLSVLQVSAADGKISEAGIKVIKEFMGFKKTAYLSGTQYLIGYGTPSVKGATITEAHADIELRSALVAVEADVNAAAAAASVTLVQKQHDALVWFGYVYGPASLTPGMQAVVFNPASNSSAIANAFCTVGYESGYPDQKADKAIVTARMAMANLFVNGVYNATNKGTFGMTVFDAGNGTFGSSKKMIQVYDTKYTNEITVAAPTLAGKEFLGFYSKNSDGSYALVTGLNSATSGKVLYARWQEGDTKVKTKYTIPASVLYMAAGIPEGDTMKIYKDPADPTEIDVVKRDAMVTIVAEKMVAGVKWVEISTKGWVELGPLSAIKPIVPAVKVTVTDDFVNIRNDSNVNAVKVATAKRGDVLTIYMLDTTGEWGYTTAGWVCLKYTNYNAVIEDSVEVVETTTVSVVATGTVSVGTALNVRASASAASARVGTLPNGTKVELVQIKTVTGHQWGKLKSGGWICLDYVNLDSTPSSNNVSNTTVSGGTTGTVVGTVELNVRSAPGAKNDLVTKLPEGTVVVVYEKTTVDNADWGRIDQGWVSLKYIKLNGVITNAPAAAATATAVVSSSVSLNVRSGPGSEYGKVDALNPGTKISIYEKQTVQGITWGRTDKGWVNMTYVTMINTGNGTYGVGGTVVNCSKGVNVRSAAGTTNALVGVIAVGSRVTVTERTLVKGIYWGRVDKGWVCMDYIQLDSEFQDPIKNEPTAQPENTQVGETVVNPFVGYPAAVSADTALYKEASSDSKVLLTIHSGTDIKITERKLVGTREFGKVTIGSTTGWVNAADYVLAKVYGIISATEAAGYEKPDVRSKTEFSIPKNTAVEIEEQSFDGTRIWGKVVHGGKYLWIDMAEFTMYANNAAPTGVFTQSGVGYLTGYINADGTEIKKNTNGEPGAVMDYKLVKNYRVNVQSRLYVTATGETWGKITVNNSYCWVNMTNVTLDKIEVKVTAKNLMGHAAYDGAETGNLTVGDVLTVLERKLVADAVHGVNDWALVYINDDTSDTTYIIMDEGKISHVTKAPVDGGVSTSVLTGIVVVGKAKTANVKVYEEADTTSKTLITINQDALVTILNWKNFDGKTWGKVQIAEIIGWVDITDIDFTGLNGTIKVTELNIFKKYDSDSAVKIMNTNNAPVSIEELHFDGKVLWGKVEVAGHKGWIDLANVKLNVPVNPTFESVIATGKINSVSSNVQLYADQGVTPGDVTLPKGTSVSLLEVSIASGKAWWKVELGDNDGWASMENLSINPVTITLVDAKSVDVMDDLVSGSKQLDTIYRGEKATATAFKMYMGDLYAEVICGDTTGWVLLQDASNVTFFTMIPGAASSSPIAPTTPETTAPAAPTTPTAPSVTGQAAYILCSSTVNVRTAPGVGNPLATTLANGTAVTVYEQTTVNGKGWGRINEGWVCMDYVRFGTNTSGSSASTPVVMTSVPAGAIAVGYANEDVKIREGAGMGYNVVATVKKNNSLVIYEKKLDGGMSWGRTDSGWVCISYLTITGIGSSGAGTMGTIARCGFTTNVRNTAGINGALMAKVMVSSRVVVYETTTVSGEMWGRTDLGWISMNYIVLDATAAPSTTPVTGDNIG